MREGGSMNIEKEREAFEQHLTDTGLVEFSGYGFEVDECDEYTHEPTNVAWGTWQIGMNRAQAHEAKKLEGCVVVPVEPTEAQWGGLARVLGRYMQNKDRYCPKSLKRHLDMFADEIPDWLNKEVPNWESEHAFATADLPVFIYKAMVEAARGGK